MVHPFAKINRKTLVNVMVGNLSLILYMLLELMVIHDVIPINHMSVTGFKKKNLLKIHLYYITNTL